MNINTQKTTPRNFLKTLAILHLALLAGPLLAGIFFYFNTEIKVNGTANDILIYIFPIIGLAGIFTSKFLYQQFLTPLKAHELLKTKLVGLQTASLIQYVLIEGPALLNIVWFEKTGNLLYLTVGGVLLIYLFMLRPTKSKIENDLELKGEHKRQFDHLDQTLN